MADSSPSLLNPTSTSLAELNQKYLDAPLQNTLVAQKDSSAKLASEYLASQGQTSGGMEGLTRAAGVLATGLTEGVVDSANHSLNWHTAQTVAESLGLGYALGAVAKAGPVGETIAVGSGLVLGASWAYNEYQGGRPQATLAAVTDAYNSKQNIADDRRAIATSGGALLFETGLAMAAGGFGMKKGLEVKSNWQVDAIAGVKTSYGSAVEFLARDGRSHGAPLLNDGNLGMAFAGKDVMTTAKGGIEGVRTQASAELVQGSPQKSLPGLSEKTRNILDNSGSKTMAERIYGSQYDSTGLPARQDYKPVGQKAIVPYSTTPEILNPTVARGPLTVKSLTELGDVCDVRTRVTLANHDPGALALRAEITEGFTTSSSLAAEGQRLQSLQGEQFKSFDHFQQDELKARLGNVVDRERDLAAIQGQAKDLTTLRLESGRLTIKLNRLDAGTAGDASASTSPLKTHLEQQKELLKTEIGNKTDLVGSINDPLTPLGKAKVELDAARDSAKDWIMWYDNGHLDAVRNAHTNQGGRDSLEYFDQQLKQLTDTERDIRNNGDAQKDIAVRFSESVYAFKARLDVLQNKLHSATPGLTKASAESGRSIDSTTAGNMVPPTSQRADLAPRAVRPVTSEPKLQVTSDRPVIGKAEATPVNARADATSVLRVGGQLESYLRDKASSTLARTASDQPGVINRAVNNILDDSTVAFFKDGKPLTEIGRDGKPHLTLVNVRDYGHNLGRLGNKTPDGYAIITPVLQADGTMAVLPKQPASSGAGSKVVLKKEVTWAGGIVPSGVEEGTSFGKLFSLMRGETTGAAAGPLHQMPIMEEWVTPRTMARSLGIKPYEAIQLTKASSANQVLSRAVIDSALAAHGWKPVYAPEVKNS